ncbi:MAG: ABC transporter permease [Bacteroidetes bacterium]|nr:ABC transporter permease [Bacteroidota bacterium]MBU1116674.1 ABC transporter permease [Bacteroidota bacterium]MBU1798758.1 ABC transporter permease [Bacteroidota bacterium]
MRKLDFLSLTFESTRGNILRTFLSIISVVIGVFSFVFVVSLNEGMAESMMQTIKNYGGYNTFDIKSSKKNMVMTSVTDSKHRKTIHYRYPITLTLIDSLNKNFNDAIFITELVGDDYYIKGEKRYRFLGVSENFFEVYNNIKIEDGRKFNLLDIKSKNNVIVIAKNDESSLDEKMSVGDMITINNYQFEIIGEYVSQGLNLYSRAIFIPITTFKTLFYKQEEMPRSILCKVEDVSKLDRTIDQVQSYLDFISEKGIFRINSREDSIKDFENMSSAYSNLILLFSILMLVTGGIGIMNIMLSSIKERMREIGIKKAVGAKNRDIFVQFFLETMFLFFIGGSIGIILAVFSVESVAEFIIKKQVWGAQAKALITFRVIITSIIFSGITGFIFGLLPAIKASKVMPIDSLRYE